MISTPSGITVHRICGIYSSWTRQRRVIRTIRSSVSVAWMECRRSRRWTVVRVPAIIRSGIITPISGRSPMCCWSRSGRPGWRSAFISGVMNKKSWINLVFGLGRESLFSPAFLLSFSRCFFSRYFFFTFFSWPLMVIEFFSMYFFIFDLFLFHVESHWSFSSHVEPCLSTSKFP